MRTRYGIIVFTTIGFVAFALVAAIGSIADGTQTRSLSEKAKGVDAIVVGTTRSLSEKAKGADVIVIGTVAEIETNRWTLTLFEKGSDGKRPILKKNYDLAVLHSRRILKSDMAGVVNEANSKKPVDRMKMAFQRPTGGELELGKDLWIPSASKGDNRIWFLRRDLILTGHYFIWDMETVTEAQIKKIEELVKDHAAGL